MCTHDWFLPPEQNLVVDCCDRHELVRGTGCSARTGINLPDATFLCERGSLATIHKSGPESGRVTLDPLQEFPEDTSQASPYYQQSELVQASLAS